MTGGGREGEGDWVGEGKGRVTGWKREQEGGEEGGWLGGKWSSKEGRVTGWKREQEGGEGDWVEKGVARGGG